MDELNSATITTVPFERLGGGIIRIGEMEQPVAVLTFLRYVG